MRIYILFFCFLNSFVCGIFAEGTTASFLKLGFSARARGLGESFSAVSETPDAIFYNPAGITNIQRNEINFSYGQLLENVNYNSLRYTHSLYNNNAIGIMINYLSQSSIEGRDINRRFTGEFGSYDMAANFAYGFSLSEVTFAGLNFKHLTSKICDESSTGWAFDFGLQYRVKSKGLNLGVSVQNIGPKMRFIKEYSPLPLTLRTGIAYSIDSNILFLFDVSRYLYDRRTVFSIGTEYVIFDSFFVRAGYNNNFSNCNDLIKCVGFKSGFGIRLKNFNFDYALSPFGDISKVHILSIGARF